MCIRDLLERIGAVDRLEERGFIRRVGDPADRRVVLVELTDEGRETIDETLPDHAANEKRLLASLSSEEQRVLITLLKKLHQSLDG